MRCFWYTGGTRPRSDRATVILGSLAIAMSRDLLPLCRFDLRSHATCGLEVYQTDDLYRGILIVLQLCFSCPLKTS